MPMAPEPEVWISIQDHELIIRIQKSCFVECYDCGGIPASIMAWISILEKKR